MLEYQKKKPAIYNYNKGITLVGLIVTIVIMLILAGVTISLAINGGLFERGAEATRLTDISYAEDNLRANLLGEQIRRLDPGITRQQVIDMINRTGVLAGSYGNGWNLTPGNGPWTLTGRTLRGNEIRPIIIDYRTGVYIDI